MTEGGPRQGGRTAAQAPPGAGVEEVEATLARMRWSRVERSGPQPAQMVPRGSGWQLLTWRSEVGAAVRELAIALLALGHQAEDAVALLSRSRAEWVQADFAIFSVGGITVPIPHRHVGRREHRAPNDREA